jgi:hypothetical protein
MDAEFTLPYCRDIFKDIQKLVSLFSPDMLTEDFNTGFYRCYFNNKLYNMALK